MKFAMRGGKLPAIDLMKTGQKQAIYNWQNGVSLPSVDNFIFLAAILGVTIDEILVVEGTDGEDPEDYEDPVIFPLMLS